MIHQEGAVQFVPPPPKVFFRERARLARDLGVLAIRAMAFSEPILVAETFAGTGIRSLRYLREVPNVEHAYLNDLNSEALQTIEKNARLNRLEDRVTTFRLEANNFHYTLKTQEIFPHVLDLDAFGSPVPFLDSAFHAVREGGVLYVTATDLPALCGVDPRSAFNHYGVLTMQNWFCHETAARILTRAVIRAGARRKFQAAPLFVMFDGLALRGFFQVVHGRYDLDPEQEGFLSFCPQCWEVRAIPMKQCCPRQCSQGHPVELAGPLWLEELHNPDFLERMRSELPRVAQWLQAERVAFFLDRMREEVGMPPFFYRLDRVSKRLKISPPKVSEVIRALKDRGHPAGWTHFHTNAFKTTAPLSVVFDTVRTLAH